MRKKFIATTILSAFLCIFSPAPAALAADNVQVTLPSFTVTLNGQVIDNSYRQYPLLVYKDITYFPMTYYDCRFLGVETDWTNDKGLRIQVSDLVGAYHVQNRKQNNKRQDIAQLATGDITVNGKVIHNNQEEYPLLSYRNVTYFPLTWRFATNEFGWQYNFDNKKGLQINAGNRQTSNVILNDAKAPVWETDTFPFTIDAKYLYYQGEKGAIYRRPLNALQDEKQRKTIYNIPYEESVYFEGYRTAELQEVMGKIYLGYHYGGAVMGHDEQYRIDETSVSQELSWYQYSPYFDFGDFQIQTTGIGAAGPIWGPMQLTDKKGTREIGEQKYYYKICYNEARPYNSAKNLLYVTAYLYDENSGNLEHGHLYAMDLDSGKMTQLLPDLIDSYSYNNNAIYYFHYSQTSEQTRDYDRGTLSMLDLTTNQTTAIAKITNLGDNLNYVSTANGVYYRPDGTDDLCFWNKHTGTSEKINDGAIVTDVYSQNGYVFAHFAETPQNPYRLMVFAPSGKTMKQVCATADVSDKAVINENGLLVYRLRGEDFATSSQFVTVQLPKIS